MQKRPGGRANLGQVSGRVVTQVQESTDIFRLGFHDLPTTYDQIDRR